MVHALPVHPQDSRSFRELLVDCEVRAMASRIANASYNFFATVVLSIIRGCSQLKDRVVEFIDPKMKFTNSLLKIPKDQRKSVASHALSIISPTMPTATIDAFIRAIDESSDDTLGKNLSSLITPEMYSQENIKAIETIAAVPAPEREEVIRNAVRLITPLMDTNDRVRIIQSLAAIAASEREDVIRNAVQLIVLYMDADDGIKIIESLASIPANERDLVTALALQVDTVLVGRSSRRQIISAIAAIAASEREDVIRNAVQLITPRMLADDGIKIIQSLASVPANERDLVTALALQVAIPEGEGFNRANVIRAIAAIAAHEREDVIANAVQLITPHMYAYERINIIEMVAEVPAGDRANFVENRRRGRHHRQPAVAVRRGVNVHEGNRDQRTKAALELLHRHQGEIGPARIREAKEAFVVYLENSQMEEAQKQLAKDALSKPRGDREDFGPLISDTVFSILGFELTGEELIGRLWIYASSLEGNEKTNAKEGMISALIKSYEDDSRVCNQGKTQRLVVAVLQGRLAGVNLEGEIVPEQVPKHQALTMFFNIEANKGIDGLEELLEAANTFCNENPGVNRGEFVQAIRAYADLQDIT